ncbi:MAG: amidohydrolase [Tannerella sp.]|nr:amidohydrolase [Tannerella sp.]
MSILIKSIKINGIPDETDILIEGNRIKTIGQSLDVEADTVISGHKKAIIPGFVNMHTHAAMTLFRGAGDDMPLKKWLHEVIWPKEAKLTGEDIYWGTKLACLEMIKSGTTTFSDMYFNLDMIAEAVEEMGLRAVMAEVCFDHLNPSLSDACKQQITNRFKSPPSFGSRIRMAIGPHAIYTVSGELLKWIHDFAKEHGLLIHIHLSETEEEVENCIERYGMSPVRYLRRLGVLSPHLIVAHALHVDKEEITILAENGVKVVHNPASNMKLASGYRFKYHEMREAGITVGLGTDGCASSNSLDMIEAMRRPSYMGKAWRSDPTAMTCDEMLYAATRAGAEILGLDAGRIAEGALADLCMVDLNLPAFTPNFNFVSNLVYAANGSCIDTVICDGKILMRDKKVPGEDEILEHAGQCARALILDD